MDDKINELNELNQKYSTGNYICVVENRFGGTGYFIKEENSKLKENWNYTLIHKKHQHILEAYLKDNTINIVILIDDSSYKITNFIEKYDESYNYAYITN